MQPSEAALRRAVLSPLAIAAWCGTKRGFYDYDSNGNCPMAQFVRWAFDLPEQAVSVGSDFVTVTPLDEKGYPDFAHNDLVRCEFTQAIADALVGNPDYRGPDQPRETQRPLWSYNLLAERMKALVK